MLSYRLWRHIVWYTYKDVRRKYSSSCPENGSRSFLQNVPKFLPEYTASLPSKYFFLAACAVKRIKSILLWVYLKVSLIQAFRYESLSKHFTSTGDADVGNSVSSSLYNLSCFSGFFASWYRHELTDTDVWNKYIFISASYRGLVC